MKHVFTDISTIAHLWANQLQDEATNSRNFYFRNNTIYSYGSHFPIARHVTNDAGVNAILLTEKSYSNTTAKHIRVVEQAVSHKNVIYCDSPNNSHALNFEFWINEAEAVADHLPTARKPEKYLNQISRIADRVRKYADFFSLQIPPVLAAAIAIENKAEFSNYVSNKKALLAEQEKAERKAMKTRHTKALAEWKAGKTNRMYIRDGYDYLRANGDNVETSQGVKLPMDVAKRIYNQIKDKALKAGSKIIGYDVDQADGKLLKVGCHTFKNDYLLKFGQKTFNQN